MVLMFAGGAFVGAARAMRLDELRVVRAAERRAVTEYTVPMHDQLQLEGTWLSRGYCRRTRQMLMPRVDISIMRFGQLLREGTRLLLGYYMSGSPLLTLTKMSPSARFRPLTVEQTARLLS